ncbi:hypothetical protein ACROYT_G030558 [Oculina patagonica]
MRAFIPFLSTERLSAVMELPMFRGVIKYVAFLGVLFGIGIITKILQQVLENTSIKALYISQYDSRLLKRNPSHTVPTTVLFRCQCPHTI